MAYVEIRKKGRLVSRRVVDDAQAGTGCKVFLGEAGEVQLSVGQSKTVGEYEISSFEGSMPGIGETATDGLDGGPDAFATGTQDPSSHPAIEGYEIIERLGQGGMGTVWKAVDLNTRRQVAIKFLGRHRFGSDRAKVRFEREVALAAQLTHSNIARVYASGLHRGIYYYVMELIDGIHLDEYVQQKHLSGREIL